MKRSGGDHERWSAAPAGIGAIARDWLRIGLTGFGGPPAHIALLRRLVVEREGWMTAREFQDANAACGLLPGPASTQLAIFCAWRVGGVAGALVGGLCFIVPAVVLVIALSTLFLSNAPPEWVRGAGAGASAAVAAVAARAARDLLGPSYERVAARGTERTRWLAYLVAGVLGASLAGSYLVAILVACGVVEFLCRRRADDGLLLGWPPIVALVRAAGGPGALAWTAFKVGALSFGGGFVIIPLIQGDAVHTYHWMTNAQFLNAVAIGQVTPGPVVATVSAVGYAAAGMGGGVLAAAVAFAPSFCFVLAGARRFTGLRSNRNARAFLDGAGPAAIGAIAGAAITLARALVEPWQFAVLVAALVLLLGVRRGVVEVLVAAGAVGVIAALSGASVG